MRTTDWTQELSQEDVEFIFSEEAQNEMYGETQKDTVTKIFATHPALLKNRNN